MIVEVPKTQDSMTNSRVRSEHYAKHSREKIECRRLARTIPLSDSCEFCGSTQSLERHHFAGYRLWWIFVTACKQCHEWVDMKNPRTVSKFEKIELTQAQIQRFADKLGIHYTPEVRYG